jgi:dienelactone hydrolase
LRRLELVLAAAALVAVVWPVVFGVRPKRGVMAVTLLVGVAAQLQVEGFRWQMIPLYLTCVGLAIGDVIFIERELRWTNRFARGVFGTAGILAAAAIPLLLPVPLIPVPSGGMPVGTVTVEVTDFDRDELYGENPGGPRRFVAQVWYPAAEARPGAEDLWTDDFDVVAPALSRKLGLPSWFLGHTRYTRRNSQRSAPIAPGSFPVIVYSHGWTGFRSVALTQMEALASNGYIVIAPDHAFGAVATRFPDGEVVRYDPDALPDERSSTAQERQKARENLVRTFAEDVIAVLDELELGVEGQFANFVGAADLSKVGVFGHSTGGGAAIWVCLVDERCDAVVAFDPWVEALPERILRIPASRPQLFMRSDEWRGTQNDAMLRGIAARGSSRTYWLGVQGAGHNDFTLAPLLTSWGSRFGFTGSIGAGRMLQIVDNYLVGFFDVYLLGTGSAALDSVAYPEVSMERIEPRS